MKIFFASQSFYPHIGGVSTYLLNLSKGLLERGHQVSEIHLRPPKGESKGVIEGIDIYRVPREPLDDELLKKYSQFKEMIYNECNGQGNFSFDKPISKYPGFDAYYEINEIMGMQIAELLENNPAEIVHVHDFQLLFLSRYIPRGIPLILTWHIPFLSGISNELKRFLVERLNEFDRIIFSSEEYINEAKKAGVIASKLELIYPLMDTDLFTPIEVFNKDDVRKKYGFESGEKIILCVQRVDSKSGHEQLIKSLPAVLKEFPNTKLVFVGGDSLSNKISDQRTKYNQYIKKLILDLNLKDNIIFLGSIDYFNLPEVYQMSDVSALTSRMEGFGLALSEGMAMEKPVIGTNVGGIPLQIKDGVNGYLVEPGDYEKTAEKIISLLKNLQHSEEMGKKARDTIMDKFNPKQTIEKHMTLYHALLNEKCQHKWWYSLKDSDIDAVILDFDRTFTDENLEVQPEFINALKNLRQKVIVSTGRPFLFVQNICKKYPFIYAAVAENGAMLYLHEERKVITMNSDYQKKTREIINKNGISANMGDVVISVKRSDEKKILSLLKNIRRKVSFRYNVDELMILPKNVNKGNGVNMLLQYLGIKPERVVLFGDGENDMDLFNVSGLRVAVGNAHSRLKAIADIVAKEKCYRGVMEILTNLNLIHTENK